jgi:hypothetical protein
MDSSPKPLSRDSSTLKHFCKWLLAHGADVLSTYSDWELCRFRTGAVIHTLYTTKRGELNFSSPNTETIYWQFVKGETPNFHLKPKRPSMRVRSSKLKEVLKRDGDKCVFCQKPFTTAKPPTLEHFLALIHGGSNHLSNLAAAHPECNAKAGHLSILQKLELIIEKRSQK